MNTLRYVAQLDNDTLLAVIADGEEWSRTGNIPEDSIIRTIDVESVSPALIRQRVVDDAWRELAFRLAYGMVKAADASAVIAPRRLPLAVPSDLDN